MSKITRRRFLQASAAAAAVPALGHAAAVRQDADPFGGFTVGIQSYSYRNFQPLQKALEQIQTLGIPNHELYQQHPPPTAADAPRQACPSLLAKDPAGP